MATGRRWIYFFGNNKADGRADQKELLGGKGAGLAEMTRIGLPVPAGFTISTEACAAFHDKNGKWPAGLEAEVRRYMVKLERSCHKKFGSTKDPLLVSVRSGAARSMPGMMETILNLGLNDESVEGLAKVSGDRRFAFDAYRRLIMMYACTAKHVDRHLFDAAFDDVKNQWTRPRLGRYGQDSIPDTEVSAEELERLVAEFKNIYQEQTSESFPQDPFKQLKGAIDAVFGSWMAEKAETYRRVENITGLKGTAVNVCQMVFGNMGDDSGTGVCFTRDPSTGENVLYGDVLINAQGEDVVAGVRTPLPIAELKRIMPDVYDHLEGIRVLLETHYRDMQDLEFTVERGKLYMLQTRVGKRSPAAAFKIAVDQATKGMISTAYAKRLASRKFLPKKVATAATKPLLTREEAIQRIQPADVERLFYPIIDPDLSPTQLQSQCIAEGIGAVPGAACGQAVFSAKDAEIHSADGTPVILVRNETSPEDVGGMHVAAGILTATGGRTSHAAVVARGWGKCCIVGCGELNVQDAQKRATVNGRVIRLGDFLTLDGSTGSVYEGRMRLVRPTAPPEFDTLMSWCDERRRMQVRTNADTPQDAARAVDLGAEGIGLCRTEHMFFDASQAKRLVTMRMMILADSVDARRAALEQLLPYQRGDFEGIFTAMDGLPVTIRLIDPPLHEFLPQEDNLEGLQALTDALNQSVHESASQGAGWDYDRRRNIEEKMLSLDEVRRRIRALHELNPMLGHRGCRLCITFPEILDMQVRAIVEAAVACAKRGVKVLPEIMIPLTIDPKELSILVKQTRDVADAILREQKSKLKYLVGTMIETPRAVLTADKMAETAEFFSFGTNDLTQLALGLSRDDAGRFLPDYVDENKAAIFPADPFQSIDEGGVGMLVRMAVEMGRLGRKDLKLGVCGEHGGDPASILFFEKAGLDYVSCSPPRVPVARLAAAQAAIILHRPATRRAARPSSKRSARSKSAKATSKAVGKNGSAKSNGRSAKRSAQERELVLA